jgi:hypothetical protein
VSAPQRVQRRDLSEIPKRGIERLPSGAVRISATPTRIGVFLYPDPATGEMYGELRPPEEVFSPDSMASLRGVALTELHPPDDVTPDNWRERSRGHVCDDVRAAGANLDASVVVADAGAIGKIDRGEIRELSCGYTCAVEYHEERTWTDGSKYRATQRGIRYNHLALLPLGHARGGPQVRLHLDGLDPGQKDDNDVKHLFQLSDDRRKIRVADKAYDLLDAKQRADGEAALRGAITAGVPRADSLDEAKVRAAYEQLRGLLEGLPVVVAEMGAALAEATASAATPEQVMSMAMDGADVITEARRLVPDLKLDGMRSLDDVRAAVVQEVLGIDASKQSADFVLGAYETARQIRGGTFDETDLEDVDAEPGSGDDAPPSRGDARGARARAGATPRSAIDRHRQSGRDPLGGRGGR